MARKSQYEIKKLGHANNLPRGTKWTGGRKRDAVWKQRKIMHKLQGNGTLTGDVGQIQKVGPVSSPRPRRFARVRHIFAGQKLFGHFTHPPLRWHLRARLHLELPRPVFTNGPHSPSSLMALSAPPALAKYCFDSVRIFRGGLCCGRSLPWLARNGPLGVFQEEKRTRRDSLGKMSLGAKTRRRQTKRLAKLLSGAAYYRWLWVKRRRRLVVDDWFGTTEPKAIGEFEPPPSPLPHYLTVRVSRHPFAFSCADWEIRRCP